MINIIRNTIKISGTLICISGIIILILAICLLLLHIRPAVVVSGSMEPTIHTGSIVFIDTEYDRKQVVARDIIAFDSGENLVTHRVKKLSENGFITKGDANSDTDPGEIPYERFRGRVIMWFPWIGYTVGFMWKTQGKVIVIAALFSGVLMYSLLGKEGRKDGSSENRNSTGNSAA